MNPSAAHQTKKYRCRPSLLILFGCLLLCLSTPAAGAESTGNETGRERHYLLGAFPFIPATSIEGLFAPIAAELSAASGHPVILRTTDSYEKFMAALERREYDIAFVQPFDYVEIAEPRGYLPLARRNEELFGTLATRTDSGITSIRGLKGKTLGLPPAVAAVSIISQVALRRAGLAPGKNMTVKHFASHQACLQQLLVGYVDACCVSPAGVRLVESQLGVKFREIGRTSSIPHALFVAKRELPLAERKAMLQVLATTGLDRVPPEYRTIFLLPGKNPFLPATDRDYDPVRRHLKTIKRQ